MEEDEVVLFLDHKGAGADNTAGKGGAACIR